MLFRRENCREDSFLFLHGMCEEEEKKAARARDGITFIKTHRKF
jgi:hypothetical protein